MTTAKNNQTLDSFFMWGNQHSVSHLAENTMDILFDGENEEDSEEKSEDEDDEATL